MIVQRRVEQDGYIYEINQGYGPARGLYNATKMGKHDGKVEYSNWFDKETKTELTDMEDEEFTRTVDEYVRLAND